MYYKLIAVFGSRFSQTYNICDAADVKPGMEFTAHGTSLEWSRCLARRKVCIHSDVPVIHFCDSAVDMLLWYNKFVAEIGRNVGMYFYQIEPMTKVYREKSRDGTRFVQCGANKIKIVQMLTLGRVFRDAKQEAEGNYENLLRRYPHINMHLFLEKFQNIRM